MLDLDGLKGVNDAFGHACGDDLLAGVAELLRGRLRGTDVAARLGGDEFALILPHTDGAAAETLTRDILNRIGQAAPLLLGGSPTRVSASAGIAEIGGTRRFATPEDVLHQADGALYAAMRAGRDCVRMADPGFVMRGSRGPFGARERTLEQRGLELYAQPILALSGDTRDRRELLLRLRSEDGGIMAPGGFLAGAERSELILEVDRWVIHESARILAGLQQQGHDSVLHVNLSARSLTHAPMGDFIATEVARAGVDPSRLVFEITESAAITRIDQAQRFAEQVAELGCGLALDDFGAGFASFHYLKYLEFDFVKIDGGLVRDVVHSPGDQRILRCIVDLAQGLGKRTIAEWVTDEATLEVMRTFGVDYAQGFHVSVPSALPGLAATS
jgi:diguanylate cyclase (GGDEF)-like protein